MRRERLACIGDAAAEEPDDREAVRAARSAALRAIDPNVEEHAGVRATGHRIIERLRLVDTAPAVATRLAGGVDQDASAVVRAAAASALGALGGADALDALRQALLRDAAADVRAAAARELGELGDDSPSVTDALIDALRDEAGVVRLNARRSLRQLHGADLGLDPRTWRLWLEARARGRLEAPPADGPPDEAGDDETEPAEPPTTADDEGTSPAPDGDGGTR